MYKYEVTKSELITPTVLLLSLKSRKDRDSFDFYPGQYVAMSLKRFGRPTPMRCFSIVSSPNDTKTLQFGIRVQGDFTNAAKSLKPGNKVNIKGPFGEFVIDEDVDKNILLLAGGIGITPFISMVRYATENKLTIPITLLYSCQTQDDVPFYDELLRLEKDNPYFKVAFFITTGDISKLSDGLVKSGRINRSVLDKVTLGKYLELTHFICGPTPFISALQKVLIDNHVRSDRLITEAFGQGVVTEKSHKQPNHQARFVYAMSGFLFILATVFITGIDLVRALPKIQSIESSQSSSTSTQGTTDSTSSPSTNSSSNNSDNSSNTTTTTPTTQTNISNPTTSVS